MSLEKLPRKTITDGQEQSGRMTRTVRLLREFGRAETIAERKARLEYDRLHPWQPISQAEIDGSVCELQFCDMVGNFSGGELRFVLTIKPLYGRRDWLCVNRKGWAPLPPCGFRKTGEVLGHDEIARMQRAARF